MAQYVVYHNADLVEYTDGVDTFRDGSRDNSYVIDMELTSTGFTGIESVDEGVTGDWMNLESYSGGGLGVFRDGVRDNSYVIDEELTGTGFAGAEDTDWVNVSKIEISPSLRDKDGNEYTTVIIGSQEWTVENLRTSTYADGAAIPEITDGVAWLADINGAYCYYDNDIANDLIYGKIYNWFTIDNAHGLCYFERSGVQEIGWRIPSNADWDALTTYLGGVAVTGGKMKEVGLTHWLAPNEGATNSSGFTAFGSGWRNLLALPPDFAGTMAYEMKDRKQNMWSSDQSAGFGWKGYGYGCLYSLNDYLASLLKFFDQKEVGAVVRCVRDV